MCPSADATNRRAVAYSARMPAATSRGGEATPLDRSLPEQSDCRGRAGQMSHIVSAGDVAYARTR